MKHILIIFLFALYTNNLMCQTLDYFIDSLIDQLTLDEKIDQISRDGFFSTKTNLKFGIPGFKMSDGPHGYTQKISTCYPQSILAISSWDQELWMKFGVAMGEDFLLNNSNMQLAPCLDISRDPRNGRNAESIGEDPFLGSIYGEKLVTGIQSNQIIATIKHFIGTNKENNRTIANILLSDYYLENVFGKPFKRAIQEGGAFALMSSYNKVNELYSSQNNYLIDTLLRKKWGYPFFIVSDWSGIVDAKKAVLAGNDLCMGNSIYKEKIPSLIKSKELNESDINKLVKRLLFTKYISGIDYSIEKKDKTLENQNLALEIAQKSIILLKNENKILPIPKNKKIALIGPSAKKIQLDAFGSSRVNPPYSISPYEAIIKQIGSENCSFSYGCPIQTFDTAGFDDARKFASQADVVLFFGGLDETMEGEGFGIGGDRKIERVELPDQQLLLIKELHKINKNIVVILQSGGVCSLGEYDSIVKGFIYAFYPGMEGGTAIADILFGNINPSGKLPVSIPKNTEQLPNWNDNFNDDFGGGYRYYNKKSINVAYPFGFGLSYSNFSILNHKIEKNKYYLADTIKTNVSIKNNSLNIGEEVIQGYVYHSEQDIEKRKLICFKKIKINANSTSNLTLNISVSDLMEYDSLNKINQIKPGKYYLMINNSSAKSNFVDSFEISDNKLPVLKILNLFTFPKNIHTNEKIDFFITVKNSSNISFGRGEKINIDFVKINNSFDKTTHYLKEDLLPGGMVMIQLNKNNFYTFKDTGNHTIKINIELQNEKFSKFYTTYISPEKTNLLFGKPIYSNEDENNLSYVNDNKLNTKWNSQSGTFKWLTFDLKKCFNLKEIEINFGEEYASKYYVISGYSPKALTDTIYKTKTGTSGKTIFYTNTEARFIQFVFYKQGPEFDKYSISEIAIYGDTLQQCFELKSPDFYVFPNPTFDFIYFAQDIDSQNRISIYDMFGKCVFEDIKTEENINIQHLNAGIYTITIIDQEGNIKNAKFVKLSRR